MSSLLAAWRAAAPADWRDGERLLPGAAQWPAVRALAALIDRLPAAACVASQLDNGNAALLLELALRRLGRVQLPLPPYFSPAQRAHALQRSAAGLLVQPLTAPAPGPDWQRLPSWPALQLQPWWRASLSTPWPASTATITFTSGSTGEPKGVCLPESALSTVANALAEAMQPLQLQRHLCVLPLATLLENVAAHAALRCGAELELPSLSELGYSGASGLDPLRLLDCLQRRQPDSVILVPQLLAELCTALEATASRLPSLRCLAVGGAAMAPALLERAAALDLPVYQGYGLSECASVVSLNRPGSERRGSVGRPLPHVRLRIADDGELLLGGSLMLGYLGDPAATPNEWASGDLGHLDADGFLYIDGRRRDLFITSYGRNVHPGWVEAALLAQPAIAQAVVDGEARPWNLAIIVPAAGTADRATIAAAVAAANAELPDYARVGDFILAGSPFTPANGLATGNGRPRRDAILARYAAAMAGRYATPTHPALESLHGLS